MHCRLIVLHNLLPFCYRLHCTLLYIYIYIYIHMLFTVLPPRQTITATYCYHHCPLFWPVCWSDITFVELC